MRDDLTADERQVAEMLSSVGPPRQRRPASGPKRQKVRWSTALGIAALVVVVVAGAVVLPRTLGHQSAHRPGQSTQKPGASPSTTAVPAHYLGAGARSDAGQDQWVLGKSTLAVTRDGGAHWTQLPLPPTALTNTIYSIAVLPTETVVASSPDPVVSVLVNVALTGSSAWESSVVPLVVYGQVGTLQIVDLNGSLAGVMVNLTTSVQFSQGVWLAAPPGTSGWHAYPTPDGGTITDIGGDLWLVGGVQNQVIDASTDQGSTWTQITLPLRVSSPATYAPILDDAGKIVVTATPANSDDFEVVTGSAASSGWNWADGPVVNLGAQFGPGASPKSSLVAGVLWTIGYSGEVSRVNLATGSVSLVTPKGMPALVSNYTVAALSGISAVLTYSGFDCPNGKASCTPVSGVVMTQDGGANWAPIADPLGR